MRVSTLFELHATKLAETEALCASELAERSDTDEAANAAAFAELEELEEKIIATRAGLLPSIMAKLVLALGYAKQNAPEGEIENEWRLVDSAMADLAALVAGPAQHATFVPAGVAGMLG